MDTELTVQVGDITDLKVDAIVNAANGHLWMGEGVAGAIKSKGGKIIEDEAVKQGPVNAGEAVVTTAGQLKAKYVIHAVSFGIDHKASPDKVKRATAAAYRRAEEKKLRTLAFPALGTGAGQVPVREVARVMADATMQYLGKGSGLQRVLFIMLDEEEYSAFTEELRVRLR